MPKCSLTDRHVPSTIIDLYLDEPEDEFKGKCFTLYMNKSPFIHLFFIFAFLIPLQLAQKFTHFPLMPKCRQKCSVFNIENYGIHNFFLLKNRLKLKDRFSIAQKAMAQGRGCTLPFCLVGDVGDLIQGIINHAKEVSLSLSSSQSLDQLSRCRNSS